jgi:hypothetical protein
MASVIVPRFDDSFQNFVFLCHESKHYVSMFVSGCEVDSAALGSSHQGHMTHHLRPSLHWIASFWRLPDYVLRFCRHVHILSLSLRHGGDL